jgi:hypothetical protein
MENKMFDYLKAALQSKTMWGIAIMAIPAFTKALGHEVPAADATGLVTAIQHAVDSNMAAAGLVLAIWGRTAAKGPLVTPKA